MFQENSNASFAGNTKMLELSLRRIGKRFLLYTRKIAMLSLAGKI